MERRLDYRASSPFPMWVPKTLLRPFREFCQVERMP